MKIGIDARMYGAGKNRGIGRYIARLLEHLPEVDKTNQYLVFLLPENYHDFTVKSANFTKVRVNVAWYSIKEQIIWPLIINKYNLDLMHFTHFNVPWLYRRPYVVTIHDLIMTHHRQDRSTTRNKLIYKFKMVMAGWLVKQAALRAALIFVPSSHVKQEVVNLLGIGENKIKVTYEAVNIIEEQIDKITGQRFNITKPYFFYVGAAYPHKNLELLISAWREFNKDSGWQLVLAGREDWFYQRLKKEVIGQSQDILVLGEVSEAELKWLYSKAYAFVFPSLNEGFGLPPLEAMAYGCPVISSNKSSMLEILGEAALFFNGHDKKNLLEVMKKLANDKNLRAELINKGRFRVNDFSWQRTAEQTVAGYFFIFPGQRINI